MTPNNTPLETARLAIERCRNFSNAEARSIDALASRARVTRLGKGERVASEGDAAAELIVVAEGRLRMVQHTVDGREVLLGSAEVGECISVPASLSGSRHRGDIVAAQPSTVVHVPIDALWEVVDSDSRLARSLITGLSSEMLGLTDLLKGYTLDVTARLAGTLFHLALESGRPVGGSLEFTLDIKKGELAAELGVAPETLSRSLRKLKSAGFISSQGSTVKVHDLKSLAALASGFES